MDADPVEIRVLGSLIEKQRTTPDQYPLSLNALRLACNQSTNRDPVVEYEEQQIRIALQRLARRGWTRLASGPGSRAAKYRHLVDDAIGLAADEMAVMAVLMLRGPQTPGELKQRADRMHHFAALDDVQETLDRLIERELVRRLERRPGQKEVRYEQLLGGDEEAEAPAASSAPAPEPDAAQVQARGPSPLQASQPAAAGTGRLAGRRILVVGGGQQSYGIEDAPIGNGRAMCVLFAREGAKVAVADIDADSAEETARLVREEEDGEATVIVADAADDEQSKRMIEEAVEGMGGLDGLVLNLGVAAIGGLDTPPDEWDRVFAVNVRSHFLAARNALPRMEQGGAIVFISSIAAWIPLPGMPAYTGSKSALNGLCMYMASEGALRGVRANSVIPGLIDTPLGRLSDRMNPERSQAEKRVPLRRQGTAWEVANAVLFLMSDEAAYITGQELGVDGGLGSLRWP